MFLVVQRIKLGFLFVDVLFEALNFLVLVVDLRRRAIVAQTNFHSQQHTKRKACLNCIKKYASDKS